MRARQDWSRQLSKIAIRLFAWGCIVALPILSLVPQGQIERTGLGGHAEHVLAYAGTALAVALAHADQGLARVLVALLAYGGLLEFLQRFSPGRVSSLDDFAFSASGVLLGLTALLLSRRLLCRRPLA
jgi:VanZ family protein